MGFAPQTPETPFRILFDPSPDRNRLGEVIARHTGVVERTALYATTEDGSVVGAVPTDSSQEILTWGDELARRLGTAYRAESFIETGILPTPVHALLIVPTVQHSQLEKALSPLAESWGRRSGLALAQLGAGRPSTIIWGREPEGQLFLLDTLIGMVSVLIAPSNPAASFAYLQEHCGALADALGVDNYWLIQEGVATPYVRTA